MRTLFAVSVLCLVLITGCATSPPVLFTFDLPEYSSYTREMDNRELVLNVIDVNNIGVKIIKHPAAYENGYSDKPIKSYYIESMNKVLTNIGFKLSEFTDYEFRVYILDAYVQWGMGLNVEVTSVFRSRIEITCIPDDKIVFENEYNTKRVMKATAGGPSSIPYVKRLFKNTLEAHMNEIISSINFHEIFIKSDDDSDNINQGDTPELYIKDARRNNLPIITVFDFEYEGISKNEASFWSISWAEHYLIQGIIVLLTESNVNRYCLKYNSQCRVVLMSHASWK